jgi:hypothetical protein
MIPINIPSRIERGQPITAAWANSIRESIYKLASRKTPKRKGGSLGAQHPFKVTPNGDDTVKVASGLMWKHRSNYITPPVFTDPVDLTAFPIEVPETETITATAAEGWVWLLCDISYVVVLDDTLSGSIRLFSEREVYSGTPSVIYSTSDPTTYAPQTNSKNFAIPLAKVLLADGIASIEKQYVKDDIWPIGGSYTYEPTP